MATKLTYHTLRSCARLVRRELGTSATLPSEEITIPARVHRSPTDILKALVGTVQRDPTASHYKYHDDPYLIPASNLDKRSFSLSKEAGRKAARWIRDQHPHLFTHRPDDPCVQSFQPKVTYDESSDVGPDTLRGLLTHGSLVSDAVAVFQLCQKKGIEMGEELRQGLLEMVCYYNCEDAIDPAWLEERWYQHGVSTIRKTWKDNGLAEELFAGLSHKGPAAYCALIRGMTQYYQVDRAWQLYQECREKGVALDTGTYNSLIRVASFLRDAAELRWQLVKELLAAMVESGTQPNLGTLNATLEALSQVAMWRHTRELSLQVMSEFSRVGITPSLATYYYLLIIHCRERGPVSHILLDILDHIEGKEFTIRDPKDTFFFVTAMDVSRNHLQSLEAAHRVDKLLRTAENYQLIGDSFKESIYYRHLFALSCTMLPMDDFMAVYNDLVPHVYTPEPGVMQEVLQSVSLHEAHRHLPQLWSDMIVFDHSSREKLVGLMLTALAQHQPTPDNQEVTRQLANIAKDIWERVQGQDPERKNKVTWTGRMLGDELVALVNCGEYEVAKEVLRESIANPQAILGFLPAQALQTLLSAAIHQQDAKTAVNVVTYAQDAGHLETGEMALQLKSGLALSTQQKTTLTSLLGTDLLSHSTQTQ